MNAPAPEAGVIENASEIIRRFGGIRPMASKLSVPVTTVQGWKKRDAIPANRLDQITKSAQEHKIEVADVLKVTPVNQNTIPPRASDSAARPPVRFKSPPPADPMKGVVYEDIVFRASRQAEQSALIKSAVINAFLVVCATAAVVLLLLPESEKRRQEPQIASLQQQVASMRAEMAAADQERQNSEMLSGLQHGATQAQRVIDTAMDAAQDISRETFGPYAANVNRAINSVHDGMLRLTGFLGRVQNMQNSAEGQATLGAAWSALANAASSAPANADALGEAILKISLTDPAAQRTFAGIAPEDVKAAALLLGLSQVRSSLSRDNVPFKQDLETLKKLAGPNDPELAAALDRLGPQAQYGVLTPAGLGTEFAGVAADIVKASLTGGDVSIQDRAITRLNNVLSVEKNGQPVIGTAVQAAVAHAQRRLESGDIPGAIAELQALKGPAASAALPWISKARATILAQQLKGLLSRNLDLAHNGESRIVVDDGESASFGPQRFAPGPVYIKPGFAP